MKCLKKILLLLCIFIFSFTIFGKEFENSDKLITGKLENGIHYYIYKNKKPENKAALNLVVNVGSLMEEDNEQGIAHFMEHMAFNGTTKFEKNDMIKYLQSIGLNFGGDLNAYTSFDKTVYMLLVPTTESELDNGIEVLREWASEAILSPEEIESEKKVVIEEWRLRQGLAQRLGDVQKKAMFENSRYFDRFPIGLPEVINGANQELVKGFYKKWYQPENISVIAVGDFDTTQIENLIKKHFNYTGEKVSKPKEYKVRGLKDKYVVFSDDELRYNTFYITKVLDRAVIKDEKSMKKEIIDELLFNILNTRVSNLIKEENSPFIESLNFKYALNNSQEIFSSVAVIKNDRIQEGIELLNSFLKSSAKNGITEYELTLEKENLLNNYRTLVENRESITHETFAKALVEHAFSGESFLEVEKEFEIYSNILKNIDIQDLNTRMKKIYKEKSLYFLTTSSEQKALDEKQLKLLIEKNKKAQENLDFSIKSIELPAFSSKAGTILSQNENLYTLSNGIKVYTKNTDFDKNKIYIKLFKKEGSSSDSYEEYINSTIATSIIESSGVANLSPRDINTYMKGKNFSLSSYIDDYEQGIFITSDRENLKNALEYMSWLITSPKIDKNVYNNTIEVLKEGIKTRNNSPKTVYGDKINQIYTGNNRRRTPLTEKDITLISQEKVLQEFKKKFDNFSDFNLIIVGAFEEEKISNLLEKYFASLPSSEEKSIIKPLDIKTPKNIVKENVIKGVDKKATVTLIFPYNYKYGYEEKTLYNGFSQVLNIALIEDIREKIGGVYSISSRVSLSPNNYGEDRMTISYSCDVDRIDEIKKAVFATINKLLYQNIEEEKIKSVVKNYELSYNTQVKENIYWLNYLYQKITVEGYKIATPLEYKKIMTEENLWNVNRKAINLNNYIDVTLIPEKENL